jgi:hypothetical protein
VLGRSIISCARRASASGSTVCTDGLELVREVEGRGLEELRLPAHVRPEQRELLREEVAQLGGAGGARGGAAGDEPPRWARDRIDLSQVAAPTCSTTTSAPFRDVRRFTSATTSCAWWSMTASAPSFFACSSLSALPAVAITRAPCSLATWMAAMPTPAPAGPHEHVFADAHLARG